MYPAVCISVFSFNFYITQLYMMDVTVTIIILQMMIKKIESLKSPTPLTTTLFLICDSGPRLPLPRNIATSVF